MADGKAPPARITHAERTQQRREQKLAEAQNEIDSGRMTSRQLTPEEMAQHTGRREKLQAELAERRGRRS